jgi:hypothetical protein
MLKRDCVLMMGFLATIIFIHVKSFHPSSYFYHRKNKREDRMEMRDEEQ